MDVCSEQRTCSWYLGSLHSKFLSQDSNPHSWRYRPSTTHNQLMDGLTRTTRSNGGRTNSEQQKTSIINEVQKNKSNTFSHCLFRQFYSPKFYATPQSCSPLNE